MWRALVSAFAVGSAAALMTATSIARQSQNTPNQQTIIINAQPEQLVPTGVRPEAANKLYMSPGGLQQLHFTREIGEVYIYNPPNFPELVKETGGDGPTAVLANAGDATSSTRQWSGSGHELSLKAQEDLKAVYDDQKCIRNCGHGFSRIIVISGDGDRIYDANIYVGKMIWKNGWWQCLNGCYRITTEQTTQLAIEQAFVTAKPVHEGLH